MSYMMVDLMLDNWDVCVRVFVKAELNFVAVRPIWTTQLSVTE